MQLGKYTLLEKIGAGGMAEVFRARMAGAAGFSKIVAVKRIRSSLTVDPQVIQGLIDEAKILSGLSHPNIVQVIDFAWAGEAYLLVMEFVQGRSLAEILRTLKRREIGLPPGLVVHVIAETAAGLSFAHEKTDEAGRPLRIVHRDISPQNVLVSMDGHVKLTDFGIAKSTLVQSQTRFGFVKGKLHYISPEQAQGRAADQRSDLFALGVVAFELIARRRLFDGPNDSEVFKAVKEFAGPSGDQRPEVCPPALWGILDRLLRPDPAARYPEARSLARDLKAVQQAEGFTEGTGALAGWMVDLFGPPASIEEAATEPHTRPQFDAAGSGDTEPLTADPVIETPTAHTEPIEPPTLPAVGHQTEALPRPRAKRARVWPFLLAAALIAGGAMLLLLPGGGNLPLQDSGPASFSASEPQPASRPEPASDAGDGPDGAATKDGGAQTDQPQPAADNGVPSVVPEVVPGEKGAHRSAMGWLVLNSDPWAYVDVDGRRLKDPTPVIGLKLAAGVHKIQLTNPVVKRSKNIEVRIAPGKTLRLVEKF